MKLALAILYNGSYNFMYYTSSEIDDRGAFVRQPNRF